MCLSILVSYKSDDIIYWNANSTNGELDLTVSTNCLAYIKITRIWAM